MTSLTSQVSNSTLNSWWGKGLNNMGTNSTRGSTGYGILHTAMRRGVPNISQTPHHAKTYFIRTQGIRSNQSSVLYYELEVSFFTGHYYGLILGCSGSSKITFRCLWALVNLVGNQFLRPIWLSNTNRQTD